MERSIKKQIIQDLNSKIVLLSGPRQVGKTTLSKSLVQNYQYFNYDDSEHRLLITKRQWLRTSELVVLDELHKMKGWKRWLKGIYDVEGIEPKILVTGSARLDTARRMGDSLAGRHFSLRLYPLTLKELASVKHDSSQQNFDKLLMFGGFPEPFLTASERSAARWRRSHLDLILRQDLLDLEQVREVHRIETLVELLRGRVGSPIAFSNLASDLNVSPHTVKRWMTILENLFVVFPVYPYHENIARSLLKAPKYYFFDIGQVEGGQGARFENLVALSLLKELHDREDVLGEKGKLHYLRDKEGAEVDFLFINAQKKATLIEAKWSDTQPAKALLKLGRQLKFSECKAIQLVADLRDERQISDNLTVLKAPEWLSSMKNL